jgi:DNA-binding response OmpR family regulator
VDDSSFIRALISRAVAGLGFDVAEAVDGVEGMATLADCRFDLVILDVMMPNMDGPTMLEKMRESGDRTPVIMLTAESHRPIISRATKAGIADYIHKPFKPEALREMVVSLFRRSGREEILSSSAPVGAAAGRIFRYGGSPRRRQAADLLVVDDMENVFKRLRGMLPREITMAWCTSSQPALASAREGIYRAILIDTEIPQDDSVALAQQMRQLQPNAVIGALATRASAGSHEALQEQGFGAVLYKPFAKDQVDEFRERYFDKQEYLTRDDNLVKLAPFAGRGEQRERYFSQLSLLFAAALKEIAGACYGEVIVDVGAAAAQGELLARLLASASAQAKVYGMSMSVVGPGEFLELLGSYEETSDIRCFDSAEKARAAAM